MRLCVSSLPTLYFSPRVAEVCESNVCFYLFSDLIGFDTIGWMNVLTVRMPMCALACSLISPLVDSTLEA